MSSPLKRHEKQELQISPTINQATAEGISFLFSKRLTWGLQRLFPLGIGLGVDVTGDVVEGEEKVVLFVKLRGQLDLRLRTPRHA